MMAIVFELLEELPRMGPGSQQQTKRSEINLSQLPVPPVIVWCAIFIKTSHNPNHSRSTNQNHYHTYY
jgi:hypothetical protein